MQSSKLSGIRSKIDRTKKHVTDLDSAIRAFLESRPYEVTTQRDSQSRKLAYYVSRIEDVPAVVPQIAGDALANMVSILDHLAYRLFLSGGGTTDAARHVYFPIARSATSATEYITATKRKVQGMPQSTVDALLAVEAYQGGKGHDLWVLNELNNLSKHRDLIAVGSQFRSIDLAGHLRGVLENRAGGPIPCPELHVFYKVANPICPLKVGDVIFVDAPDAEFNQKVQFAFDVAINESQIVEAKPLIEMLHHLTNLVDAIITQFEPML